MCDVQKMAPAAAHFIADRMAELGDDAQSMTLVLLSYNRGEDAVRDSLRRLRETDANYERNFWTLFANRSKLDEGFQRKAPGTCRSFLPPQLSARIRTLLICRCRRCRVSPNRALARSQNGER
jgi:hypothetical protein